MNSQNKKIYIKELILNIVYSLLLCYIMEALFRNSLFQPIQFLATYPLRYLYNAFIIFVTVQFVYLFKRRIFARAIHLSLFLILGIINFVQRVYRVEPLTAPDFAMIGEVNKLMGTYINSRNVRLALIAVVLIVLELFILYRKASKTEVILNKKAIISVILIPAVSFIIITAAAISVNALPIYFANLNEAYSEYGFIYCFGVTMFRHGVSEPVGYSEESVIKLMQTESDHEHTDSTIMKPNIIMIEMESFFDPYRFSFLEIDQDPIPVFHSLKENYSHGLLKVPSTGTGTSKTEFEVLTGMSVYFFAPGIYPYTILPEKNCESAAYQLKNLGYHCSVLHNNDTNFYDRDKVFPNLGFDTYTGIEYMQDITYSESDWAKDIVLKDEIIETLNSTKQNDFILAITVQGHGPYDNIQGFTANSFSVRTDKKYAHYQNQFEYYIEQLHETDQFIGDLIKELEQVNEETLLVIYGDHSPPFSINDGDVSFGMLSETEYVVWSNFDLEMKEKNLCSYQLFAEIFDRIDYHSGTMFAYHQNASNLTSYQNGMEILQYDLLFGENYAYKGLAPYTKTDMKLGWKDVFIHSVSQKNETRLEIKGENFTPFSRVVLNDKPLNTTFIDANTLFVDITALPEEFTVVVQQISSTKMKVLSNIVNSDTSMAGEVLSESNIYQVNSINKDSLTSY